MSKSQIGVEYIMVVGIATVLITSILIISYYYNRQIEDNVNLNQIEGLARSIIDNSEQVYFLGPPSKTTIKVFIPDKVESITFYTKEIVIKVRTGSGVSELAYISSVPLTDPGDPSVLSKSPGLRYITIEARSGYVHITDNLP